MWPALHERYKRFTVWDYSATNAIRYKAWSLPTPQVVRPGYSPVLDGRIPEKKKTHDVVFFGSINYRRKKILLELEAAGLSVLLVPFGVYGAERDELLAQAKLCINIHYYESAIFEAVRCSYLAQNGLPVVSEESTGGEANLWCIGSASYDKLVESTVHLIKDQDELDRWIICQQSAARQVPLLNYVRAAVDQLVLTGNTQKMTWQAVDKALAEERAVAEEPITGVKVNPIVAVVADGDASAFAQEAGFPELTLCMIVKNEADVIERCLLSMKPRLTKWCIVDTGSTDGTQDIIRRVMADMPGQLHERPWKGYDGSRTESLNLARAECSNEGWLALIDADEVATFEGDLQLPDGFDCYNG